MNNNIQAYKLRRRKKLAMKKKLENKEKAKLRMEKTLKYISPHLHYKKIKYKKNIYSIGDNIIIKNNNNDFYVAKITKIIPLNGIKKFSYWPSIEIE